MLAVSQVIKLLLILLIPIGPKTITETALSQLITFNAVTYFHVSIGLLSDLILFPDHNFIPIKLYVFSISAYMTWASISLLYIYLKSISRTGYIIKLILVYLSNIFSLLPSLFRVLFLVLCS